MTKRLAEPVSGLPDTRRPRSASLSAASACISPSTSSPGASLCRMASASRILWAQALCEVP